MQAGPTPSWIGWSGHSGNLKAGASRTEGGTAYMATEKSERIAHMLKMVARILL